MNILLLQSFNISSLVLVLCIYYDLFGCIFLHSAMKVKANKSNPLTTIYNYTFKALKHWCVKKVFLVVAQELILLK